MARIFLPLLLLLTAGLVGCAALPPPEPAGFLDEDTGVTLTVVAAPLVFARDRRDIAANARDYITLVAVERNQTGKRNLVLLAYRWSTIDRRVNPQADATARALVILADGRDIRLQVDGGAALELRLGIEKIARGNLPLSVMLVLSVVAIAGAAMRRRLEVGT